MPAAYQLHGQTFGRLYVMGRWKNTTRGATVWRVRCVCGTVKDVRGDLLVKGSVVSCGCYAREAMRVAHTTHGLSRSAEYRSWLSMWKRCTSKTHPAYHRYGGAGIKVCKRWEKFENFIADMGRCPFEKGSVERRNNRKGYTPTNCYWLPKAQQSKNRSNVLLFDGMTVPDLAAKHGIKVTTLHRRIKAGWPREKWFKTPLELGTRKEAR